MDTDLGRVDEFVHEEHAHAEWVEAVQGVLVVRDVLHVDIQFAPCQSSKSHPLNITFLDALKHLAF